MFNSLFQCCSKHKNRREIFSLCHHWINWFFIKIQYASSQIVLLLGDFVICSFNLVSYPPWTTAPSSVKWRGQKMQFQGVRILELAAGLLNPSLCTPFVTPQVTSSKFPPWGRKGLSEHNREMITKLTLVNLATYINKFYEQYWKTNQQKNWEGIYAFFNIGKFKHAKKKWTRDRERERR